jgi:hypothetical protein
VAVYAYPTTGDAVVSSSAHSDGRYYLQGLKTDQYQVAVLYSMNGSTTVEWYDGQPSRGTASLLGVIAPSGNRSIDVTLERPATLQGFVTDIAGNRVTSSEHGVIVYVYDAASGHSVLGNDISFAGGFQSTLMARSYKVSALNVHWSWMGQQDSLAVAYYPTGSAFSDAACMTLALQEGGVVELDQFVLPGACGGIEGTLSDGGTGAPVTSGTYFVVTVDSEGFLAGASGYSDLSAAVNGHYRLTGLRPGTYYVLALLAPLSVSYRYAQWYGNISVPISVALNATKLDPPPNALPVVVGEGMTSGVNLQFSLPTGISPGRSAELPGTYSLSQNYPNPFNPSTSIEFSLPTAGPVTLTVYNVLGEEVARLVAVDLSAGTFTTVWDATGLASGVYLYRLTAGEYVQTKKAVLIK